MVTEKIQGVGVNLQILEIMWETLGDIGGLQKHLLELGDILGNGSNSNSKSNSNSNNTTSNSSNRSFWAQGPKVAPR